MSTPDPNLPRPSQPAPERLRRAVAALGGGRSLAEPVRVGEGWDNVVYAVGSGLMVRLLKTDDLAERRRHVKRETRLSAFAARHSSLPWPQVLATAPDEGAVLCRMVQGCPSDEARFDPAAAGTALGHFLRRLHDAPLDEAKEATRGDGGPRLRPMSSWLAQTVAEAEPLLDRLPTDGRDGLVTFLSDPPPPEPGSLTFIHNDLSQWHVFVDGETGAVTGVIDWSDAVVGDPARDLGLLLLGLGDEVHQAARPAYGRVDAGLDERERFHAVRAGIEQVTFYLRTDRAERAAEVQRWVVELIERGGRRD